MITRAQAEALLTLAESLEACERLGMAFNIDEAGLYVLGTGLCENLGQPSGMSVRLAVNGLIPKRET